MTYPDGKTVNYEYNAEGNLRSKKMIAEKAGTEMGDRAKTLFEQLKSHTNKSTE